MIITFFGHSDFIRTDEHERRLLEYLAETVGDESAQMYLGGYGNFDSFAYACCKKYKETHPNVKLVFVTPYLDSRLDGQKELYDEILYPELENVPKRFAISRRNKYMAESADRVVAYITRDWGGAHEAYLRAKRKSKDIFNLANGIG